MAEMSNGLQWMFVSECDVPRDTQAILVSGERPLAAYKTVRDVAVFTNKRLIVRDVQGITGKKVEVYSLPWSVVNMWSSENAGHFDLTTEIELWTRAGNVKIQLKPQVDIRKLDHLISEAILGA